MVRSQPSRTALIVWTVFPVWMVTDSLSLPLLPMSEMRPGLPGASNLNLARELPPALAILFAESDMNSKFLPSFTITTRDPSPSIFRLIKLPSTEGSQLACSP